MIICAQIGEQKVLDISAKVEWQQVETAWWGGVNMDTTNDGILASLNAAGVYVG